MGKRVSNRKGEPSGNRAPTRARMARSTKLARAIQRELHGRHLAAARARALELQPKPPKTLLGRVRDRVRAWLGR